jgi:enoyl-CoA hydratase/carnithine racemase
VTEEAAVLLDRQGHIATLTLNRPDALNAINADLVRDLRTACQQLEADEQVWVVLVRGAGERAFCAGADLKERRDMGVHETQKLRTELVRAFRGLNALPMPTIAAVHGWALGGGFELALCCDLIVAADDARFGLTEVTLGIIPGGGGTQLLPRLVGKSRAKLLIYSGRRIEAAEAEQLGIAVRIVPRAELESAAMALAEEIAGNAPISLRQAKKAIDGGYHLDLDTAFAFEAELYNATLLSEDRLEGLRAFAERRKPEYQGRYPVPSPGGDG